VNEHEPGVETGYRNVDEEWVEAPAATVEAVRELLGPPPANPPLVALAGSTDAEGRELGYHRRDDGRLLIVVPPACPLPPRTWGLAVQLYSLWSGDSAGIGDLEDLRVFGRWASAAGAGMALINPLGASNPGEGQQSSPYYPSSRLFLNPLYLRVDGASFPVVPGRRIDRDAVWDVKIPLLEKEFLAFTGDPAFERFVAERGPLLYGFAAFCARHEGREHDQDRVRFHTWLQWRLDEQHRAAADEIGLVGDLAVGVDPGGADAWLWRDVFVPSMRIGAPPDALQRDGQDWGLPPFDPFKLQAAEYEPFIQTVRAALRHGAGLRVDHVMGLFRLFWIPEGRHSSEGTYVRYPWRDLLGILCLEATLAGAFVVGEDLGTVDPWMREELAARNVLSYRLLWFEDDPPTAWPAKALAAVTTHDLPTVAGVFTGEDGERSFRAKLSGTTLDEAVVGAYESLAASPCLLVAATLEDVLGVVERPNRPGTLEEWNWSRPLPEPLEQLVEDPRLAAVVETLNARGS
jgi:4-alpha-glucanotransferase